jgi:hypothetical protein
LTQWAGGASFRTTQTNALELSGAAPLLLLNGAG